MSLITQIEKDEVQNINEEEAKKTTATTLALSTEEESPSPSYDSQFELYYKQYFLDSSKNTPISFDTYLLNSLKLISLFPSNTHFHSQLNKKSFHLPKQSKHIKTLILDLDETLVHADVDFIFKYHDEILTFISHDDQEEILIPLILRPNLFEFLNYAVENFEIFIFTASERAYADAILDYIEKNKKYFSKRLYRQSCLYLNPGIYIKDLGIFENREMKNMIIIDNSVFCFANQLSNGILISSFFNDKNDQMLLSLSQYLQLVKDTDDIREVNKKFFKLESYLEEIKKGYLF